MSEWPNTPISTNGLTPLPTASVAKEWRRTRGGAGSSLDCRVSQRTLEGGRRFDEDGSLGPR